MSGKKGKKKRAAEALEPVEQATATPGASFHKPSRESLASRGRLGGYVTASRMSPEERSERARQASAARWEAENERRRALGLPPTRRRLPLLSTEELEPWLEAVDRRFPDRQWSSHEERRRQALLLARMAAAAASHEYLTRKARGDV